MGSPGNSWPRAKIWGWRTNSNYCEGRNHVFSTLVGQQHPSLWHLLQYMQQEKSASEADISPMLVASMPAKRLRGYAQTASAASSEAGFAASGRREDHRAVVASCGCSCLFRPSCIFLYIFIYFKIIRSTSKSRPNNIRGEKCPSVRTYVRPSVRPSTKSFFRFEWNLVCR